MTMISPPAPPIRPDAALSRLVEVHGLGAMLAALWRVSRRRARIRRRTRRMELRALSWSVRRDLGLPEEAAGRRHYQIGRPVIDR